jgi:hypothetical protein
MEGLDGNSPSNQMNPQLLVDATGGLCTPPNRVRRKALLPWRQKQLIHAEISLVAVHLTLTIRNLIRKFNEVEGPH